MHSFTSRGGRWPLVLTLAALAACADEPVGVRTVPELRPHAAVDDGWVVVTTTSGGTQVGSLRWAVNNAVGKWIKFDAALAGATIVVDTTVVLPFGTVIVGAQDQGITISGGGQRRVFQGTGWTNLRNVTVTGGSAPEGSAIRATGTLVLEHTTVTGNQGSSAAIYGDDISLHNSTVSGNTGSGVASGVAYTSVLVLNNSTVAHNYPSPGVGRVFSINTPIVWLINSIISNNGTPQKNCADTVGFRTQGVSISNDSSCGSSSGVFVADPLLGGLAANGGPTRTESIGHRSPAVNAGIGCSFPYDQRYVPRKAGCDIGAFEFTDFTAVTITIDPNVDVNPTTNAAVVTGTVKCTRADALGLGVQLNQTQKVGKDSTVVARGNGTTSVNCSTVAQPWSVTVLPWSRPFQSGTASASAHTTDTPIWVTPVSVDKSVKLIRRK